MLKCRCRANFGGGASSLSSPSTINADKNKTDFSGLDRFFRISNGLTSSQDRLSSPLEGEEEFLNERERVVEIQVRGKNLTSTNVQNDGLKQLFQKAGFTLAEVLITLGIIGVVAALTIPSIIENVEKQVTIVKLKKVYTTLAQAVKLSEAENGPSESWDFTKPDYTFFNKYLRKYMPAIVNIRYGTISDEIKYLRTDGVIETQFMPLYSNAMIVSLRDGTLLYLFTEPKESWPLSDYTANSIFLDLNGLKKPNKIGRDFFGFIISKYGVGAYGQFNTGDYKMSSFTREGARRGSYACTTNGRGMYCGALIMIDGWTIADDYPW